MSCNACGEPTPRSDLCKECSLLDRFGQAQDEAPEPDILPYECTVCGEHYRTDGSEPCPSCGARRRRYAGELQEGSA